MACARPTLPPVLLVDGNADGLELYETALRLEGIQASTAGTAIEALARMRADRPRVLVIDVRLPDADGALLIRHLREDLGTAGLFIVALSAGGLFDSRRARAAGCDIFLAKPCSPDVLIRALRAGLVSPTIH